MKIYILDDDINSIQVTKNYIKLFNNDLTVCGFSKTINEALPDIHKLIPDVLILDMKLNNELGLDILDKITLENLKIIVVSAFDSYGVKAIKYNVLDYLLKPVDKNELKEALDKVKTNKSEGGSLAYYNMGNIQLIPYSEILYIIADGNYSKVVSKDKTITITKKIGELDSLIDYSSIVRCHKSFIINLKAIDSIQKSKSIIKVSNGESIKISRTYKHDFFEVYNSQ